VRDTENLENLHIITSKSVVARRFIDLRGAIRFIKKKEKKEQEAFVCTSVTTPVEAGRPPTRARMGNLEKHFHYDGRNILDSRSLTIWPTMSYNYAGHFGKNMAVASHLPRQAGMGSQCLTHGARAPRHHVGHETFHSH
jgi:hypothetical protein